MEVPSLKGELRDLIARYLELYYVSESSKDGIRTENRYQSIRLGDLESPGVRSVRDEFLDQVDFSGKRVLDLGSNLGEMSRGARTRGASLVDGFEYDPFFVELATAIDTYGQVTRVSYLQRDITDPAVYRDHYDIVLAFSVFVYIEPVLDRLASVTDELLLLETHRLEDNFEDYYVRVVGRHFPHYAILGESDWDVRLGGEGDKRTIVAFAKDEPTLLEALREPDPSERREAAPPNVLRAAVAHRPGRRADSRIVPVDLTTPPRRALQQRFFMMFRFDSLDELLDAVERMEIDVDTLARSREIKNLGSEGWVYWFLFTKGYVQYAKTGVIGEGNVYFDYLTRHYVEQGHDPGALWALAEHELAVERVARRYRDLDWLRQEGAKSTDPPADANPVRVTVSDWPRDPPLHVYEVGSEAPLPVRHIDGWHRLCSARLSGLTSYPCELVPENLHDKPIRGAVESFRFDGGRLKASGWFLDPDHLVNYELRTGRLILATGAPVDRPDIAEAFPSIAHASASGFDLDIECELAGDVPIRFDLVVMHEIFPVGAIPLLHVPGAESFEGPTLVYQLLRPLVRRRALGSMGAILECRGAGTPLAPALDRLLPGATVTTIDAHEAGGAAPDSADLVIADAVLPSMGRDEQLAFLEAARAAVRPGGFAAVTVLGELARPFAAPEQEVQAKNETLDAYSGLFEVVDYVKGGAGNLHDLVILRKS
jgi:SAM-dependent methyltransferase